MKGAASALVLAVALAAGLPAQAGRDQARFTVSAFVPARVTLMAVDQPSALVISAEDLARGYKDVAATYRVDHNGRRGYLLGLSPRIGVTRQIEVQGLSAEVVVRGESVEIVQPGPPGSHELSLGFRFVLQADAVPGRYPLPVLVTAQPL